MSESSQVSQPFNYAHADGIFRTELGAAIIFAIVYFPLFIFFVVRSFQRPTYVLIVLSVFCLIRTVAFVLRAVLAGNESAQENLKLLLAQQILYNTGFFGLLYSSYTLVLDRELLTDRRTEKYLPAPLKIPLALLRNRHLIRIALIAGVALGITGATSAAFDTSQSQINTGITLRKASVYIFLAVTALVFIGTALLSIDERASRRTLWSDASSGRRFGVYLLLVISLLLVARESFFAATVDNVKQATNVRLWYPLAALTELLAVLLFAVPGLVPSREEIAKERQAQHLPQSVPLR